MEFDAEGNLLSPASCFERKCVGKEETKEFREDIAASGFKDVWPVLFATAEPTRLFILTPLRKAVTSDVHVNVWPEIAAHYKRHYDDHKQAYQALVRQCTKDMTTIVKTDVTVI